MAAPAVSASDTAEVTNCGDGQNFCADITVKQIEETTEKSNVSHNTLNWCSSVRMNEDGHPQGDICDSDGNFIQTIVLTGNGVPRRPKPSRSTVISSAFAALNPPKPEIHTSPRSHLGLLVQTPTWLWVPPSYWRTYTTTVAVAGYSVTITATPTMVRWKMGNGDSITCAGPGTPWLAGFSDSLSTCKYTYRHSSAGAPGGKYRITATVTFVGSFTTVGLGGMRGPLGAVTRSSSVRAPVAEIQGLVV